MKHRSKRAAQVRVGLGMIMALVIGMAIGALMWGAIVSTVPDVIPQIKRDATQPHSKLYEDGSYILGVGNLIVVGCAPVHPWNGKLVVGWCLDGGTNPLGHFHHGVWVWTVGIDSPWEDFLPSPLSDAMYFLIDLAYKR